MRVRAPYLEIGVIRESWTSTNARLVDKLSTVG